MEFEIIRKVKEEICVYVHKKTKQTRKYSEKCLISTCMVGNA